MTFDRSVSAHAASRSLIMGKGCELAARKISGVSRARTGLSFAALEAVDLGVALPCEGGEARVAQFHRSGRAAAAFRRSEVKSERKRWHEDKAQTRAEPDAGAARDRLASHLSGAQPSFSMIVTRSQTAAQRIGAGKAEMDGGRKSRRELSVGAAWA
jgi:hypothetical protein